MRRADFETDPEQHLARAIGGFQVFDFEQGLFGFGRHLGLQTTQVPRTANHGNTFKTFTLGGANAGAHIGFAQRLAVSVFAASI